MAGVVRSHPGLETFLNEGDEVPSSIMVHALRRAPKRVDAEGFAMPAPPPTSVDLATTDELDPTCVTEVVVTEEEAKAAEAWLGAAVPLPEALAAVGRAAADQGSSGLPTVVSIGSWT